MFSQLTNFAFQRSTKQAVGFYIAYLVLIIILGGLAGGLVNVIQGDKSLKGSMRAGQILAVVVVLALSGLVLKAKGLLPQFQYILLGMLGGILALFGGGLLGLIPVAYLTTRANPSAVPAPTPGASALQDLTP